MLDGSDAQLILEAALERLPCRVRVPEEWTDFFERTGREVGRFDERRRDPRFHCRGKAILQRDGKLYCIYTKNVSRRGLVFLHEEQIFPCENVRVWLPNGTSPRLAVTRCNRVQHKCYECGAQFAEK